MRRWRNFIRVIGPDGKRVNASLRLGSLFRFDVAAVTVTLLHSLIEMADLHPSDPLLAVPDAATAAAAAASAAAANAAGGEDADGGAGSGSSTSPALAALAPLLDYLDAYFRRLAEERKVLFYTNVLTATASQAGSMGGSTGARDEAVGASGEAVGDEADREAYGSAIACAFNTGLHSRDLEEIICVASINKGFDVKTPIGLPRAPNPRWYPLGFTTASAMADFDGYMGIPGDAFPTMNRIGLSAVTTGILTLANAKAVMGAEHMAEASKLVKGQAPLRFHVPERTKRSLCFEGDVRRLPRRADVWTALPPPLLALHAQLPLELSADELDVLPLLGIDPAELRRVRAAGGAKEAAVNAALRGLQESLRRCTGDAAPDLHRGRPAEHAAGACVGPPAAAHRWHVAAARRRVPRCSALAAALLGAAAQCDNGDGAWGTAACAPVRW